MSPLAYSFTAGNCVFFLFEYGPLTKTVCPWMGMCPTSGKLKVCGSSKVVTII